MNIRNRNSKYAFVWVVSIITLTVLGIADVSPGLLLVVALTYGIWHVAFAGFKEKADEDEIPWVATTDGPPSQPACPERLYFDQLKDHLQNAWGRLQTEFTQVESLMDATAAALSDAQGLAATTELSAFNAIMAATDTGELGRGFVTVAKEMAALGKVSQDDLKSLSHSVVDIKTILARYRSVVQLNVVDIYAGKVGAVKAPLKTFIAQLQLVEEQLRLIDSKYRSINQYDVRWTQLHDSMRELMRRLTKGLFQLEISASEALADVSLVQLSAPPNLHHFVET